MVQGGYAYSILETTSLHPSSLKRLLVERDKKEKRKRKKGLTLSHVSLAPRHDKPQEPDGKWSNKPTQAPTKASDELPTRFPPLCYPDNSRKKAVYHVPSFPWFLHVF